MSEQSTLRILKTTQIRPYAKREDTKDAMQEHVFPKLQIATHVSNRSGSNHKHSIDWILPPGPKDVLGSIPPAQIVLHVLDQIEKGDATMADALERGLKERSQSSARVDHYEKTDPAVKTDAAAVVPGSSNGLSVRGNYLRQQSAAVGVEMPTKKKTPRGGKNKRRKWRQPTLEHSTLHSSRSPMSGTRRSGATVAPPRFPWEHMEAANYAVFFLYERFELSDQQRVEVFEHMYLAEARKLRQGVVINASKLRDVCKGKTERTQNLRREVYDTDLPDVTEKTRRDKLRLQVMADIQAAAQQRGMGILNLVRPSQANEQAEADADAEFSASDHNEESTRIRAQKRQDRHARRARAKSEAEREMRTAFERLVELHPKVPGMFTELMEEFMSTQHASGATPGSSGQEEESLEMTDQMADDASIDQQVSNGPVEVPGLAEEIIAEPSFEDVPEANINDFPLSQEELETIKRHLQGFNTGELLTVVSDRLSEVGLASAAGYIERAMEAISQQPGEGAEEQDRDIVQPDVRPMSPPLFFGTKADEDAGFDALADWRDNIEQFADLETSPSPPG
ncbi:hypothetical protein LTR56_013658 [Elasticomyces elasticus]|nr:hypothetical protein LTR22_023708 [Elasticomyces elasticus]KAK3637485.1 hypothetical protein LTR56_013658 [Elasticomyces elasticus]KAK4917855.1 hypothetical protein LTR49_014259 [Elasticomyces elasticus]KAK5757014.1 hypothetical protein LTS12_012828 [Elasticomyces elasticus]